MEHPQVPPGRPSPTTALVLAAFPLLALMCGCNVPRTGGRSEAGPVGSAPQAHHVRSELPPEEAALACFALAEEAEKGADPAGSVVHYLRARTLDPGIPGVARRLAGVHERQGDVARALEEYGNALRESPKDAELHNDLGYCLYTQGDWKAAEASYRKSIALNSRNPRAWNNLGMALGQQGRLAESKAAFSRAVSPAEAECNLGFILLTQGKKSEAKSSFERALVLRPDLALARANLDDLSGPGLAANPTASSDPALRKTSYSPPAPGH